ncbi:MAG: saccharopine dehydrogenase NADP-binding domain-containing protein [Peptostreptococcaceae bacterium]|nr:saccharopine dehydrogenase NADP-binding domain-containing protein [Peptostreptococcaceae bacterium]
MKLCIIGAGGVGTSAAKIIKRAGEGGNWAEKAVISDYDLDRAKFVAAECNDPRFVAEKIDATDAASIKEVFKKHGITFAMNKVHPLFNENIFDTCLEVGVGYLDCAMTLSYRNKEKPYEQCGIKLGDYQVDKHKAWEAAGNMAIVGSGVEPGMADCFARFADKHLFDTIDQVNVRDGDNYAGQTENLVSRFGQQ